MSIERALRSVLPNLTARNWGVTSPSTNRYNCIAWAAGDNSRWWWPEGSYYWPDGAPRECSLSAFLAAFGTLGYEECATPDLERPTEKIAIFALQNVSNGSPQPTHAARQLSDGRWTSKLGPSVDIVHSTLHHVSGTEYGIPVRFMGRGRVLPTTDLKQEPRAHHVAGGRDET